MVTYCLVSFEEHYPTTLVASSEIVSSMVKLNCRDDIGFGDVLNIALVTKALCELPRGRVRFAIDHLGEQRGRGLEEGLRLEIEGGKGQNR
jgi:hypothetical protein